MTWIKAAIGAVTGASPLAWLGGGAVLAAVLGLWIYVSGLRSDNATLNQRVGTLETQRTYLAGIANGNAKALAATEARAARERASAATLRADNRRIAGDLARVLETTDHAQPTGAVCTLADRAPDALVDALRRAAGLVPDGVR